ncbi:unnamed protein product [Kuraishia capsulata CBS 1993]|uniref:Small ribosomal subunit protein uS5m n=1 Tax=Kuraishia capsulata CBS 1993 TaxID=1382522 RepID=W6MNP6_9ASCO|nr:uncharacterized protein KUCA_T00004238001 [Kuraishia capsulata CBS 1993]CDK28256.1 unnamed protein product [Kuraishia capsulata CBS 1993]
MASIILRRALTPRLHHVAFKPFAGVRCLADKAGPVPDETKQDHLKYLSQFYSPELLESIKIAESTVSPEQWKSKKPNTIEFAPKYLDDLSKYDEFWDKVPDEKLQQELIDYEKPLYPQRSMPQEGLILENLSEDPLSTLAMNLYLKFGLDPNSVKDLHFRVLQIKFVSNQTGNGKIGSYYAIGVVGNKNGMVGIGEGRDLEKIESAVLKARWSAIKNMQKVERLENRTIYGAVESKLGSSIVKLRSAPPGSGLRVNPVVFAICQCAGIKDLGGNVYRSRNKMNVAKAAFDALTKQVSLEEIASRRGKKVVDLRKTYYSAA